MRNIKFKRRWLLVIPVILIIGISGFVVWASTPSGALMQPALDALKSDSAVKVEQAAWITFTPTTGTPTTGLIFYPGGRVQAEAYAPAAHRMAAEGYQVVIVPMPLQLAIFGINKANDVIAAYPTIEHWVLSGHSLGGSMAANYVKANPGKIAGLVLLASYPQASDTLASFDDLVVATVYGTLDGLATPAKIDDSRPYLPTDTLYVPIEGGNHAQFGWYGDQAGDNPATITREAQQDQVVEATFTVLKQVSN